MVFLRFFLRTHENIGAMQLRHSVPVEAKSQAALVSPGFAFRVSFLNVGPYESTFWGEYL